MIKRISLYFFLFLMVYIHGNAQTVSVSEFQKPGRSYAPMTWWHWVNGHITRDGLRKDLISLHQAGMRGVQVFNAHMYMPKGPIEYASQEWLDLMVYAVEVCDSLGLKFVTMNSAGWSGSGGPWIDRRRAMKKLVFAACQVGGGKKISIKLPKPVAVDNYLEDIATLAVPAEYEESQIPNLQAKILMENSPLYGETTPETEPAIPHNKVIDVSSFVNSDGRLIWNAPDGKWTVIRFFSTLTGKKIHPAAYGGEGYEVDKLNREHVAFQFQQSLGKLLERTKPYHGNTFEGILFDSYEAHFQNWTENILQEFKDRYGYSLINYLPLFSGYYVESVEKSEEVLSDYRNLLDYLLATNYYGTMQRLAHEYKLVTYAECQGGLVSTPLAVNFVDIPMNEFWNPDASPRLSKMKLTTSLAATRNKHIVAAEAFTSRPEHGKWQNTPWTLKKPGDMAFTTGINRFCFHTFVHQPVDYAVPGFTMGRYGTLFSRHNTWWKMSTEWITYLTRSQYLLQQGRRVTDICYLFNREVRYAYPDSITQVPPGFDYTVIYPQDLVNAQCADGDILLESGSRFRAIVLPGNWKIDKLTAKHLLKLVQGGCWLICTPQSLPFPEADYALYAKNEDFIALGKGKIFVSGSIREAIVRTEILPDVVVSEVEYRDNVYFTHRETEQKHIYYLSNQKEEAFDVDVQFKVDSLIPELWDQTTGAVKPLAYTIENGTVTSRIPFDPYGSLFVVFDKAAKAADSCISKPVTTSTEKQRVTGPWRLDFEDKKQMEDQILLDTLTSLHEFPDDRIKYYSGRVSYTTEFTLTGAGQGKDIRYEIDLGEIHDLAEVQINDKETSIIWKKPYVADISKYVKEGNNTLKITVVNTWVNRIIGDEKFSPDALFDNNGTIFTKGRCLRLPSWLYSGAKPDNLKRFTFTTWQHYHHDAPLIPSGLVGPVHIIRTIETNSLTGYDRSTVKMEQEELIAASQTGASPLFFYPDDSALASVKIPDFPNPNEFSVRDGLPNFFSKIKSNKNVTIGYIGGSITRSNKMYRMQSLNFIQRLFPNVKVTGINAGISGTGADLGACRIEDQILQYNPDLVFIEFAVNRAFAAGVEGIIRQIRQYNPKIDICMIYTISDGQTKIYAEGDVPPNISRLERLAEYYAIPSVHLGMQAAFLEKQGKVQWKGNPNTIQTKIVLSADGIHPLETGGNLYAESIARAMLKMKGGSDSKAHALPPPFLADNWGDAKMVSPLEIASFDKHWEKVAPLSGTSLKPYAEWFPYVMKAGTPGASFSFRFEGSMFGIFDIGGPEVGQLEIELDGQAVSLKQLDMENYTAHNDTASASEPAVNRFSRYCNNRYRGQCLFVSVNPGVHHVKVILSAQKADKKEILGKNNLKDFNQNPDRYDQTVLYIGRILLRGRVIPR